MKKILAGFLLLIFFAKVFGQKQTYDVITFSVPTGWQQQQNEGGIQLSIIDKKTGKYALAAITKSIGTAASSTENFNLVWNQLIKGSVQTKGSPTMEPPSSENGWDIISGSAVYTDAGTEGMVSLITATGGGKMTCVVLMTNSNDYQNELLEFLQSLELKMANSNE